MAATEQNKAIMRRFWEEIFNGKNLALIDELFAADWVYHGPAGQEIHGPEGLKHASLGNRTKDLTCDPLETTLKRHFLKMPICRLQESHIPSEPFLFYGSDYMKIDLRKNLQGQNINTNKEELIWIYLLMYTQGR